jgi:DNA-3-methyladenine glycosylase II
MKQMAGVPVDEIELAYQAPFDWQRMLRFYGGRSSTGVETVEDGCYIRTLEWQGDSGLLRVRQDPHRPCLIAQLEGPASRHLGALEGKLMGMFDLYTDPAQVRDGLGRDPWLQRLTSLAPGLRIPGAWSAFELVVRTIVGQQVSVKAATTITGRLVARAGRPADGPTHAFAAWQFPTPPALAAADLNLIGMPGKRVAALQHFAQAVADGLPIDATVARGLARERSSGHSVSTGTAQSGASPLATGGGDIAMLRKALLALPGIGPWTVEYVAMRAWRDSDAWPGSDLVLMQAIAREHPTLLKPAQQAACSGAWRPWRAYAAMHLWNEIADQAGAQRGG